MILINSIVAQITGDPIGEVRAVSDMHQRKAEMARQADAFIALPGRAHHFIHSNTTGVSYTVYSENIL